MLRRPLPKRLASRIGTAGYAEYVEGTDAIILFLLWRARPREAARDWLEFAFGFDCLGLLGITWDCLEFWTVLPRPAEAGTPNPEEFIARLIPLVVLPCEGLRGLA